MIKSIFFFAIFYSLSFSTKYEICFIDRFELKADSIIVLNSANEFKSKFIYLREPDKVTEVYYSKILQKDTIGIYFLNDFQKTRYAKVYSIFLKYDYDNQKLIHVCNSDDSSFSDCANGETFLEYQGSKCIKMSYITSADTESRFISYNDSGDVSTFRDLFTNTNKTKIDSINYDYKNEIVHEILRGDSTFTESYYYFSNGILNKIEQYQNGRKNETWILFHPATQIKSCVPFKNISVTVLKHNSNSFTLNGKLFRNRNSKSFSMSISQGAHPVVENLNVKRK